jgi:hypothetical protein
MRAFGIRHGFTDISKANFWKAAVVLNHAAHGLHEQANSK